MGNSLAVVLDNYIGNAPFPYRLSLRGSVSAAIDLSADECRKYTDDGVLWMWDSRSTVLYTLDGLTCELRFLRFFDEGGNVIGVWFLFHDSIYLSRDWLRMEINIIGTNLLKISYLQLFGGSIPWTKTNRTVEAWGGVVDTKVYLYGSGNRQGLLVVEESRKYSGDEEPYAVTLVHYFANNIRTDIGLSVVAKITAFNRSLVTTVEGLEQHPAYDLFNVFDEVYRTGIWKPTMCRHCATTWRQSSRMLRQSGGEDNNSVPTPPPLLVSLQNARRSIANFGSGFTGNANGSFIVNVGRYFNW